jgi:hypothetical protein
MKMGYRWMIRLYEEVKTFFEAANASAFKNVAHGFHEDLDAGHARVEGRRAFCSTIGIRSTCDCLCIGLFISVTSSPYIPLYFTTHR